MDEICTKLVPDDVLTKVSHFGLSLASNSCSGTQYMTNTMATPADLWRMRKQFALQVAATSFMTFVFCLTSRAPSRFHLSRSTGLMTMSEMLPGMLMPFSGYRRILIGDRSSGSGTCIRVQ
jgi:transformation/transcription domain-associated protein